MLKLSLTFVKITLKIDELNFALNINVAQFFELLISNVAWQTTKLHW